MGRKSHGDPITQREAEEDREEEVEEEGGRDARRRRPVQVKRQASRQGTQGQGRVERQRLTPLAESGELLGRVRALAGRVLVGLSGGKDSLATLDLCVREFGADNVSAFYMYMVRDLRCVETTVRAAERRYKLEVLRLPHWQLGLAYKYAVYMPHRPGADQWRDMRMVDVEQLARQRTGAEWIAYGHRANDSIERVGMLSANGGFDPKGRRVYPLRSWNEAGVVAYLRHRKISPPPKLTFLKRSMTGVSFQEDVLITIRDKYPDDFARILEIFPFVPAKLARYEMKKKSWKQDTYSDKWHTSLKGR